MRAGLEASAAYAHPAKRHRLARRRPVPILALVVTTIVLFAFSGGVLWHLGLNYDGLSGSAASKIHPSTYLAVFLVGWTVLASGNPVGAVVRTAQARPASLFLLCAGLILAAHIALRSGSGLAGSIDTFVTPALVVMVLASFGSDDLRALEKTLHAVMLVNALLGLAEFASGTLVFPYRFDGAVFPTDTRSAALQGHPLVNAFITSIYLLALLSGGGSLLAPALRFAMIVLQLVALVTFGGRSATVLVLLLGGAYALVAGFRVLRSGRVPLLGAGLALVIGTVAPIVAVALAVGGFFDQLLERFVSDGGSANARVEMFELFDRIPLRDLMFGPDTALVDSLRRVSGLEWGIENPIVRMALYQGIVLTTLLTIAVVVFVTELVRRSRAGTFLPVLAFAILLNSAESLASKTTMLTKFAVLILVLYRPQVPPPAHTPAATRRGR
ncbi:VpsF family polysaccharide biosynthesis protein [Methylobacterium iners]|uniref:O-antigen ligase domain-containing protein n=1 Tax=Methylobacterium iners TaxID=418707 RepID=A0ABQ4S2X8_9HYPH|nr:VpsF family polysaccharide biosynthesis protein [Methylobacterium iners]GJD96808.1 hypothetical protein OCOJLMKI_4033 [Methylobacterium iners]